MIKSVLNCSPNFKHLIGAFVLTASLSCTKGGNQATSTIRLAMPDFNQRSSNSAASLSTVTTPSRIMINIQGPGIDAPIVFIFEAKNQSSAVPTSIPLTVPRGSSRLIQALFLTKTVDVDANGNPLGDGVQTFYYGDMTTDLANSDESRDLTVSKMNITQGAEGAIAGRLIDDNGNGPTGRVAIKFAPPNGSPPMIVSQSEMHGGWFEFIAFEGLKFSYSLENGRDLFPNFTMSAIPSDLSAPRTFVTVPPAYKPVYTGGSEVQRDVKAGGKFFLGFFGTGSSAMRICYDNSTSLKLNGVYSSATVGDTNLVPWSGGASPNAAQAGPVGGGTAIAGGNCDGSANFTNYWSNWIKFDPAHLGDGHGIFGTRGPFRLFVPSGQTGFKLMDANVDATNNLNINWAYLPGSTGTGRVNGVGVFARTLAAAPVQNNNGGQKEYEIDDGIACNKLTDSSFLAEPFKLLARVSVSGTELSQQTFQYAGYATQSDYSQKKVEVVLCPYSDSRQDYFTGAISNVMGDNSNQISNKEIKIAGVQNTAVSTCTPYTIGYFENSLSATPAAALTVALTSDSTTGLFYSTATCTGGTQITTLSLSSPTSVVYYQDTTAKMTRLSLAATGAFGRDLLVANGASNPPTSLHVVYNSMTTGAHFAFGYCYPIDLTVSGSLGDPSNNAPQSFVMIDNATPTPGSFYSDSTCATALPSNTIAFAATDFYQRVYYKAGLTAGSQITASGSPTPGQVSYDSAAPTIASLSLNHAITTGSTLWYAPGTCFNASVLPLNSVGAITAPGSATNVTIGSSGNILNYSINPDCSSASPNLSLAIDSTSLYGSSQFYVKVPTGQTGNITATSILATPAVSTNTVLFQQPDTLSLNYPATLMQDFCHAVTLSGLWSGVTQSAPQAMIFNISSTGGTLYQESTCTTVISGANSQLSITASTPSSKVFYFQTHTPESLTLSLNGVTTAPVPTAAIPVTPITILPALNASPAHVANACVSVDIAFSSSTTAPMTLNFSTITSSNLLVSGTGSYFYGDSGCSAGTASATPTVVAPVGSFAASSSGLYVKFISSLFSTTPPVLQVTPNGYQFPTNYPFGPTTCTSSSCN
jgi:hypothetical protein